MTVWYCLKISGYKLIILVNLISVSKKFRTQAGVGFAIKSELKKRPYIMLGILMLVTIIYLGLAMRTFEL